MELASRTPPGNDYGLWTAAELTRGYPTWSTDAPGTPARAAVVGGALVLHPAPIEEGTATVDAQVAPARLSTDDPDAVPDLPEELHPGLAGVAVYRSCLPYSQTGAQVTRLNALLAEANVPSRRRWAGRTPPPASATARPLTPSARSGSGCRLNAASGGLETFVSRTKGFYLLNQPDTTSGYDQTQIRNDPSPQASKG